MIRKIIALGIFLVAVGVIVAVAVSSGSGSSGPDPAACRAAMKRQFDYGMSHPDAPEGTRPAACQGVSDKDIRKFAGQIISEYNGGTP